MSTTARIDKWLWEVRIYKTRSIATEECRKGRVTIGGLPVKPSRDVKVGEIVEVRKPPVTYKYKVLQFPTSRIGAKLLPDFLEDITPKEELEILEMQKFSNIMGRERGTGRPTKKERRDMEDFMEW